MRDPHLRINKSKTKQCLFELGWQQVDPSDYCHRLAASKWKHLLQGHFCLANCILYHKRGLWHDRTVHKCNTTEVTIPPDWEQSEPRVSPHRCPLLLCAQLIFACLACQCKTNCGTRSAATSDATTSLVPSWASNHFLLMTNDWPTLAFRWDASSSLPGVHFGRKLDAFGAVCHSIDWLYKWVNIVIDLVYIILYGTPIRCVHWTAGTAIGTLSLTTWADSISLFD